MRKKVEWERRERGMGKRVLKREPERLGCRNEIYRNVNKVSCSFSGKWVVKGKCFL
jgi:hypothetical protein